MAAGQPWKHYNLLGAAAVIMYKNQIFWAEEMGGSRLYGYHVPDSEQTDTDKGGVECTNGRRPKPTCTSLLICQVKTEAKIGIKQRVKNPKRKTTPTSSPPYTAHLHVCGMLWG